MYHYRLSFLIACLIAWSFSVEAQDLTEAQKAAINRLVDADVPSGAPGMALGIVRNGVVIYERYAGLANLEREIAIDSTTRFNAASNGKQFTALCILELATDGKVDLEEDFRTYLPGFYSQVQERITVTNLLNHTSGIRDVYALWSLQGITWWAQTLTNADALALLRRQEQLNFPPGTHHDYSNSNYLLLAEIVSRVSGQDFTTFSDSLFGRLGMTQTAFESDHTSIRRMAKPYFNFDTWKGYEWLSDLHGDGALFTTLPDRLRWEQWVLGTQKAPLSLATLDISQRPIPSEAGNSYGYGLEFDTLLGRPITYHDGSTGAWKESFIRFPDEALSVVVLSNSGKVWSSGLVRQCARIVLNEEATTQPAHPITPGDSGAPLDVALVAGTYRTPNGYFAKIISRGDSLTLVRFGRDDVQLVQENGGVYQQVSDPSFKQHFQQSKQGTIQMTFYHPSHAPYTFTQVPADFSNWDAQLLEGAYLNTETGTNLALVYQGEKSFMVTRNGKERPAEMVTPSTLLTNGYRLEITPDENGAVATIELYGDRLARVRFLPK